MATLTEMGEEGLRKMLEVCTDFTTRRQIRRALREIQFGAIPGLVVASCNNNLDKTYISNKMAEDHSNPELEQKLKTVTDEDALSKMLLETTDFHDRRKIRTAIREMRKKKLGDHEGSASPIRSVKPKKAPKQELNLDGITDEAVLRKMLEDSDDYEDKKKIRAAIKDIISRARDVAGDIIMKDEEAYEEKLRQQEEEAEKLHIEDMKPSQIEMMITEAPPTDEPNPDGSVDFTKIHCISTLEKMLADIDDFGERTQIRARIKELREQDLEVPDYPDARRLSEGLEAYYMDERGRRRSSLIDRAALEELNKNAAPTDDNICYDEIEDPAELERLLEKAVDIGEKRQIRGCLKELQKRLAGGTEEKTDDVKPPAAAPAKTLKPTGQLYGSRKFYKSSMTIQLASPTVELNQQSTEIQTKTSADNEESYQASEAVSSQAESASQAEKTSLEFGTSSKLEVTEDFERDEKVDSAEKESERSADEETLHVADSLSSSKSHREKDNKELDYEEESSTSKSATALQFKKLEIEEEMLSLESEKTKEEVIPSISMPTETVISNKVEVEQSVDSEAALLKSKKEEVASSKVSSWAAEKSKKEEDAPSKSSTFDAEKLKKAAESKLSSWETEKTKKDLEASSKASALESKKLKKEEVAPSKLSSWETQKSKKDEVTSKGWESRKLKKEEAASSKLSSWEAEKSKKDEVTPSKPSSWESRRLKKEEAAPSKLSSWETEKSRKEEASQSKTSAWESRKLKKDDAITPKPSPFESYKSKKDEVAPSKTSPWESGKKKEEVSSSKSSIWESNRSKKEEFLSSKSSAGSKFSSTDKNKDTSIKPDSKLSTPEAGKAKVDTSRFSTTAADSSKTKVDASKFSTPSRFESTQRENEKNKKESTMTTRTTKFGSSLTESAKTKTEAVKLDKNGKVTDKSGLFGSRMSKFSSPAAEPAKLTTPGSASASGSKLGNLRSKFSSCETTSRTEFRKEDRALKGTAGKVSQVSSKFGGSCSGSSCGSTPAHSPSGSVPSSPRRSFGTIQAKSGVAKSFEFGNISSPSIAPSTVRSTKTETTAVKTKYGDNKPSSDSQNVSSSKYATKTFESSSSSTSSSKTSTPYGMKTTKVDIPYGKDRHEKEGIMSLEIKTTGDRTIRVEPSSKSQLGSGTQSTRIESKFGESKFGGSKFGDSKFGGSKFGESKVTESKFGDSKFGSSKFGESKVTESKFGGRSDLKSSTDHLKKKSAFESRFESKEKSFGDKMPPVMDEIEDEDALEKMLEAASEFEERKKIRARLREVRKKKREEQDKKIAIQQKAIQDDIVNERSEAKAQRLKAFDKYPPLKPKDSTTVALNNNTQFSNKNTTVEDTDGKTKTKTTTSVTEGPGSKSVTTTMQSKTEDKDSKSEHFRQESRSVKTSETGTSSSFSAKSSSVSSSMSSSSSGTPTGTPARKMSKFEMEMEEKRKQREMKRTDEEKNWKEYMAKNERDISKLEIFSASSLKRRKQDDYDRKKREIEAAKKKKDALMNKFGGKADESGGFGKGTGMSAVPNANTIKQKLLEWCQRCARGYPEIQITNFSSSWADGMAFCAVVHYHFPTAFDFETLEKKNRRKNFDLAFDTAEKYADIMPLLETDDMIMMKNKPDWKCVFTYVQSLYRHLSKIK
ncbi:microtubule-associated protein futsch-like [Asterias rubens]|uniref:microtubule-associated protein futsch-like n=1 Tax=Asterias rubens TaxID=7604 RepID=UPI00145519A0|nr:microtubule-associated protein futsch-like [Asterias rubens]